MIRMMRKLAQSIREFKSAAIITPIMMVGEAVIETFIPFVIAELINKIEAGCEYSVIVKYGIVLLISALISLTFGGLAGVTAAKASAGFGRNLRHDIFKKIQGFSFENIDKFSTSSLVTRMTTDVGYVRFAFMMLIRIAVRAPLMLIFSSIMAYIMAGRLALMFVVVVPILVTGLLLVAKYAMPTFRRVFKKYDKLNESIEENVSAMRTVKGFVREEYEKEKLATAAEEIRKDFTKAERIIAANSPLMQFCLYFNMIFVLLIGSYIVISTTGVEIGMGQLSAMLTYGLQVLSSLMMLSMIYVMLTMSTESARRIYEILCEESTQKNPENAVAVVKDGSIDFENVSFKYSRASDSLALSDINLHIKSGETVGIIGGTGSGKSSLVQLISRLYDVHEGSVKVGGVDVREYDMQILRDEVSVVLQKNVLFSGTIAENLRWGNPDATDEEVVAACKLAQADDFIMARPEGYNTMIEQGGSNVSGGQKQRLCIARALLKKPKILILDDSTSAVDTRTDALIRQGFRSFIPETTKIIIAQRIASVEDADKIIVLDGGKIVAEGTHDELLNSCDIYRELYVNQHKEAADNE